MAQLVNLLTSDSFLTQFWKRVDKSGDCWLWTGARTGLGYGLIGSGLDRRLYAHRVSWVIHYGEIPKGFFICHSCDNPPCINPAHLFLGTQKENMADCRRKGRIIMPPILSGKLHPRPAAILDEGNVVAIRVMGSLGDKPKTIGERFGVAEKTIRDILNKKSWRHVA